jgi:hypothetical protein
MPPICPRVLNTSTSLISQNNVRILNVFPNPAQKELVISFLGPQTKSGKLIMYNTVGQNIFELTFDENDIYNNQLQLDVSHLAQGLYNGSIEINNQTMFFKFVKETGQ